MIEHSVLCDLHPEGFINVPTACKIYDVHHQTLRRWWKAGKFPAPVLMNGMLKFRNQDLLEYNKQFEKQPA